MEKNVSHLPTKMIRVKELLLSSHLELAVSEKIIEDAQLIRV